MIPQDKARRIVASVRLFESPNANERLAALEAVLRQLPDGLAFADLVERGLRNAPPVPVIPVAAGYRDDLLRPWRGQARDAAPFATNEHETQFLMDVAARKDAPTPRQRDWLNAISARANLASAA